jgi:hypothetical protein
MKMKMKKKRMRRGASTPENDSRDTPAQRYTIEI